MVLVSRSSKLVRCDRIPGETLEVNAGLGLVTALEKLDGLSAGVNFVMGHNVLAHDFPVLRDGSPDLALLRLPVIDTLHLSPLAFPQNPYHRLVKDYKLIRDSLNSPLSDCRSTLTLFADQQAAFKTLFEVNADELLCYQALVAPALAPGLGHFFFSLTQQPPLPISEVAKRLPRLLAESDPAQTREPEGVSRPAGKPH